MNPSNKTILIFILLIIAVTFLYFLWIKPLLYEPISSPLSLPTRAPTHTQPNQETAVNPQAQTTDERDPQSPSNLPEVPVFAQPTPQPEAEPVCGKEAEWLVLAVGIDYRGDGYLYGLADVIRVLRIDFVNMTVNMIALPRDLLVEAPPGRFTAPDPYKINQAYLFGTPGMGHYRGTGEGAGALAEVIQYNFGLTVDHYGVINFDTFAKFIDAIGGVQVDLPSPVYDDKLGSFPSGVQTLSGERALALARIREGYSDSFRVDNQTLILRGVLNKLIKPDVLVRIPSLLDQFSTTFLTDLSLGEIASLGTCFLRNFDDGDLKTFSVPKELLSADRVFIPTIDKEGFVYRWDQNLIDWMYQSLLEK